MMQHLDAPNASPGNFVRHNLGPQCWSVWLEEMTRMSRAHGNVPVYLYATDHPEWGPIAGHHPNDGKRTTW